MTQFSTRAAQLDSFRAHHNDADHMHMILGMVAANAGVALVPAAARKFRRAAVIYRMLEPGLADIETAIAWRRDDKSPMLAEFIGAARHRLSRRAH